MNEKSFCYSSSALTGDINLSNKVPMCSDTNNRYELRLRGESTGIVFQRDIFKIQLGGKFKSSGKHLSASSSVLFSMHCGAYI